MANQKTLTASNIRYLLTIQSLDREGKGARSVDIATEMGLSKPSVHNMMRTLIEMGLVRKDFYGAAYLTETGRRLAVCYDRYYHSVSGLLRNSFPELSDVQPAACYLLSEIPSEDLETLCGRCEANCAAKEVL